MSPADEIIRAPSSPRLRIRPPVRPWRLVVGLALVVGGVLSCWALMARASERHDVLIVRGEVAMGDVVTAEHLGVVAVGSGDDIPTVAAGRLDEVVGRYARYRLAAGALLVDDNLQSGPLVTPGRALVSVVADAGDVPAEVAVGDGVVLVLVDTRSCGPSSGVSIVDATVTSAPHRAPGSPAGGSGAVAVSLEVDDDAVAAVALSDRVVIARPNSPEADAAVATAAGTSTDCDEAVPVTWPGAADSGAADDPSVQQPVPTGVTPMDPADVLVEADP